VQKLGTLLQILDDVLLPLDFLYKKDMPFDGQTDARALNNPWLWISTEQV
jgi:hypothetical protein